jgi:hypothetical protein
MMVNLQRAQSAAAGVKHHDVVAGRDVLRRSGGHAWSNLLAACCASPDSMICRLSSSPSLTQSQLHDAAVSLQDDDAAAAADEGDLHTVLWVKDAMVT